jgi:hypothetical protein
MLTLQTKVHFNSVVSRKYLCVIVIMIIIIIIIIIVIQVIYQSSLTSFNTNSICLWGEVKFVRPMAN